MKSLRVLGTCRPLLMFFALAFGLSWGNVFLSTAWPSFPFLFPYGPLLAALIVAGVTRGTDGLKELANRCLRWRVGPRWYAAAILVPVALALAAVGLNVLLGAPMPSADRFGPWYPPLLLLPEVLFDAPLGEESGWRGYALPLLPAGGSALTSSLVLGVLVAGWHLPIALSAPAAASLVVRWAEYTACVRTRHSACGAGRPERRVSGLRRPPCPGGAPG
jgi:membrane protease YdiL (CAAX protease family)